MEISVNSLIEALGITEVFYGAAIGCGMLLIMLLITFILMIVSLSKISKLKKQYESFMEGSDGKSIEKLIKTNLEDVKQIKSTTLKNSEAVTDIYEKLDSTFCKIGVSKYDAFYEMGGKLSFALCMLDKKNNGYIVNVMHGNDGCFAYIKEVVSGKTFIDLGEEEKKALDIAVAGKTGDAAIGPKVNELLEAAVEVDEAN